MLESNLEVYYDNEFGLIIVTKLDVNNNKLIQNFRVTELFSNLKEFIEACKMNSNSKKRFVQTDKLTNLVREKLREKQLTKEI